MTKGNAAVLIDARGVSKTFGEGVLATPVLYSANLALRAGELSLLMGPSGSGKTTLISILAGLMRATKGTVDLCGERISDMDENSVARVRRRRLGFVFQSYNLFPALTALDNVALAFRMRGTQPARAARLAAAGALDAVGLGHRIDYRPGDLSAGQKQRVAIARALAGDPAVIIGDEVTAALDTQNALAVMELLRARVTPDRATLIVTHDMRLTRFADRIFDGGWPGARGDGMRARNALLALAAAGPALLLPVALSPHFWKPTAQAESGPIADRVVLRAVVVAADGIAEVAGPASGRVTKVLVRAGDAVTAGQLLAEVANDSGGSASRIEAPIAGTVLARRVDPGDSLAVAAQGGAAALFEIADTSRTEVHAEIEERDAGRVHVGQTVRLSTPGGRRQVGTGVVAHVTPRIERRTIGADDARVRADGAVQAVRIRWEGAPPSAPIGQRLEAEVTLPTKSSATRVPRNAVVVRDGRTVVETPALLLWSREVPVIVGAADARLAEVEGVEPGTRVFLQ